ncbi:hypoxanthine phosphoribosyltransferase [Alkaliphilus sp. MSJ-5]|uniref:Hypoxanthine phosphoribosyltransferase n=1 Tax=Alkaliphilus flagellatus TaxID=2841507 RepID=A0ABS6G4G7_9FIRM|nr:hypoxanthine phosphoribosyltransferase [Alkaliphilus flagellatus]MBU5677268.1 hypoxanthine phosphoribosyltransferase [Alkaliphilus flagellatus]
MHNDVEEILFSKEDISRKVKELGEKISKDYNRDDEVVVVGVLKGANVFMADLIREIDIPVYIDFMAVSSYGYSTESSGIVRILKDLDLEIEGKHVLIIEDIIDTGLTLKYLTDNLKSRNIKSLKICTLLDKPKRRKCDLNIDYIGFEIPDKFIVGYGIDYGEKYRNLPYVASLKEETYK